MKGQWFVMYNPNGGYIVARVRDVNKVVHSGNLEYYGNYSDDKENCQKVADKLNESGEENN